jgi:hypothetical protein
VGGELMFPIHWATFNLALHPWTEPGGRALEEARRTDARIVVPRPGERFEPDDSPRLERCWPELPWHTAQVSPIASSVPVPAGM